MTPGRQRSWTVALAVELVAVAALAGFGPAFPTAADPSIAWGFLATHAYAAAHAALGALVLVHATALAVTARARPLPLVALAGTLTSVAAGAAYVSARQPAAALTAMTAGWLTALVAATAAIVRGRRPRTP
ncbi:hypothetical protein [Kineosporia sp. R_H_3]|uniref:hypothetical protein n=1 Tax=Kineosporia sp. R_H_3 TaxID=1961848 RepID=UPI001179ADDB|nr:hypothetical protein [Kineosporia sp. R_H_3]